MTLFFLGIPPHKMIIKQFFSYHLALIFCLFALSACSSDPQSGSGSDTASRVRAVGQEIKFGPVVEKEPIDLVFEGARFEWISVIDPPSSKKEKIPLQATAFEFLDDIHFGAVVFNMAGDSFEGALDIISTRVPDKPEIIAHLKFDDAEFNEIARFSAEGQNYLALGGASEADRAIVRIVNVTDPFYPKVMRDIKMSKGGFVTTSLSVDRLYLWIMTGDTGGLWRIPLEQVMFAEAEFLFGLANGTAVLGSDEGAITLAQGSERDVYIGLFDRFGFRHESRSWFSYRTLQAPARFAVRGENVATHAVGRLAVFNRNAVSDGLRFSLDPMTHDEDYFPGTPNGLDWFSDDGIVLANGEEGLIFTQFSDGRLNGTLARAQFKTPGSANHVRIREGWVMASFGRDGLRILRLSL